MVDFSIHSSHIGQQAPQGGVGNFQNASGVFMGQVAVEVQDPLSMLADSAEELTFSVDTTEDFELSERKEDDKDLKHLLDRLKLHEELMHKAGKSEELTHLVDQLRSSRNKEDTLRQVRERFPDPADAYAALNHVLEKATEEGYSEAGIRAVREAQTQLMAEEGPAIHSGIQASLAAQSFADLDSSDNLRTLYRRAVFDFASVNAMFTHILDTYGEGRFDQAITFLTRTLGADMDADVSSMGKPHLENTAVHLGQVRLLQSVYAQCVKLLERWQTVHEVHTCSLDAQNLMGKILELRTESFVSAYNFEKILAAASPPDIEREVLFLQDMMHSIRSLPSQLFDTPAGHLKVLSAAQEAVDKAIEREDAYYAAQAQ